MIPKSPQRKGEHYQCKKEVERQIEMGRENSKNQSSYVHTAIIPRTRIQQPRLPPPLQNYRKPKLQWPTIPS